MKKGLLLLIMLLISVFAFTGCTNQNAEINSDKAADLYGQLSGFKGIELYIWKDSKTKKLYCGMLEGTNRNKNQSDFNILYKNPVDLKSAKEILKGYKSDMYVFIDTIGKNITQSDIKKIKREFKDLNMENLTYFIE